MNRRGFLTGLTSLLAAPAIVPFASLMPVRGIVMPVKDVEWLSSEFFRFYSGPEIYWNGDLLYVMTAKGELIQCDQRRAVWTYKYIVREC